MKKLIFIAFCLSFLHGCKKPKTGRYALTLTYDQSYMGQPTIYGDETKVTLKNIYYGGAFSDISGVLDRKNKKVNGSLMLFPNNSIKQTIILDGVIERDGAINKYRIVGTFSDPPNYTGKFTLNPI